MDKLIRGIPDDAATILKEQAKASGLTLEAYLRLKLIELAKEIKMSQEAKEVAPEQVRVNFDYSLVGQRHTANQYWQHKGSGDIFAIRMVAGEIEEAAGPLYYKDVTAANLQAYNFSGEPEDAKWCTELAQDFRLCAEPYAGDE